MRNTQIINLKQQLLTATMTSYPSIDGHFWVVRNGEIIDTDFEWYDYCRRVNKCVDKTPHHLEADATTQMVMIGMYKKITMKVFKTTNWDECAVEMVNMLERMGRTKPQQEQCWQNAVMEVVKNGGEIKFGSLGWAKKNGSIHWEYGGADYTSVKQFLN